MEEKKFGYIYLTTNLVNGYIYYGQHKKDYFDTKYYGTGKTLLKALKKYGKENFKCELIEWCYSLEQLNEREQYWIKKTNSNDRHIGYNITDGGSGSLGYRHSEETREKISKNNSRYWKGKQLHPNTVKAQREYMKTHPSPKIGTHLSEETKEKIRLSSIGKKSSMKGKKHTEESRKKMRLSHLGVKTGARHNFTEEEKTKISNSLSEHYEKYGFGEERFTEKQKQFFRESAKDRTYINNGSVVKRVKNNELEKWLEEGWKIGKIKVQPNENTSIRINNGIIVRRVRRKFVNRFLENGWVLGNIKKKGCDK